MSSPARFDWSVGRNETTADTFTYVEGRQLVPLTDTTVKMEIRWTGDDGGILLTSGIDPEIVILDQEDPLTVGRVSVNLSPTQRQSIPTGRVAQYRLFRLIDGTFVEELFGDLVSVDRLNVSG